MEADYKVSVKNTTNHPVLVILQDARFQREWPAEAVLKVPYSILEEGLFDKGLRTFIEEGILFIEEKEVRVALGLEEEGGPPVVNVLNRGQMVKLLKVDSVKDFTKAYKELTKEQRNSLIDIALKEKMVDIDKVAVIKEYSGIDILKAIQLNSEPEKKEK